MTCWVKLPIGLWVKIYTLRPEARIDNCLEDIKTPFHFTQAQMIDSAFIVYDMQSDVCQEFNGKLGCSWLDEIHSNSDRDQISFPHVVKSLGLKLPSNMLDDPGYRDKIYTNEQDRKMMHVARRCCHWYYDNISRCIGEDEDNVMTSDIPTLPTNPNNPVRKGRVAVIIAGTLKRFILESILITKELLHEFPVVDTRFKGFQKYKSCAIVGNGGSLKLKKYGKYI